MSRNIRSMAVVSGATLASRLSGLGRDVLLYATLGANLHTSAFLLAFTLPNLLRRLLGEGALSSALVPVFSSVFQKDRRTAFGLLNAVGFRLFLTLSAFIVLVWIVVFLTLRFADPGLRWTLVLEYTGWLFPYLLPVCLAALFAGVLGVLNHFAVPNLTPMVLNFCIIGGLLVGPVFGISDWAVQLRILALSVLVGGFLQLLLPLMVTRRFGWHPQLREHDPAARGEVWSLFLPGIAGAAILQVNLLVSRGLAYTLEDDAVSLLFLASRMIELPLGLFAVAIATVIFPVLSRDFAANRPEAFQRNLDEGFRLTLAITLPAACGLLILAHPILSLLFQWGAFSAANVNATAPILMVYAAGIPFYSLAGLLTRVWHSRKQMKFPVRVAGIVLVINVGLSLLLMGPLDVTGLALANVLASIAQVWILVWGLRRQAQPTRFGGILLPFLKVSAATLALGALLLIARVLLPEANTLSKAALALQVLALVAGGAALHFALLYLLRFDDLRDLLRPIMRR